MHTPTLGILMVLATLGLVAVAAVALLLARLRQRPAPWRPLALAGAAWVVLYAGLLGGASLTSRERVLGFDEDKKFCGFYLDCHMQVAVTHVDTVRWANTWTVSGGGMFYRVTLRVSSDAGAARLRVPHPRVVLHDAQGHRYQAMVQDRLAGSREVGPGEAFTTCVVFYVPDGARPTHMDVTIGVWADRLIERFLIGDEDSLLHPRTVFHIGAS